MHMILRVYAGCSRVTHRSLDGAIATSKLRSLFLDPILDVTLFHQGYGCINYPAPLATTIDVLWRIVLPIHTRHQHDA